MGKYFELSEMLPRVADAIRRRSVELGRFVDAAEIEEAMLADDETRRFLIDAQNRNPDGRRLELHQIAGQAIAWYGQQMTTDSPSIASWKNAVARERAKGAWSYRWLERP